MLGWVKYCAPPPSGQKNQINLIHTHQASQILALDATDAVKSCNHRCTDHASLTLREVRQELFGLVVEVLLELSPREREALGPRRAQPRVREELSRHRRRGRHVSWKEGDTLWSRVAGIFAPQEEEEEETQDSRATFDTIRRRRRKAQKPWSVTWEPRSRRDKVFLFARVILLGRGCQQLARKITLHQYIQIWTLSGANCEGGTRYSEVLLISL